jgi:glycerol-3-phosphate O-acyltransferase
MSENWSIDSAQVTASRHFAAGLPALAAETGKTEAELRRQAAHDLHELRTGHAGWVHRLIVRAGRALCGRAYDSIEYDEAQLERTRAAFAAHPCVVLSSHKSYLDGGALTVGFHDHGLPPLTVFAGINMAFWPIGPIWRRANGVFMRRSGGDPVYAYALRQQLGFLLEQRRPLQWFIEGTRSRTGKLGPPKLGLLVYALDAWRESRCEDLLLVPVAVAYDQLRESEEYAEQARGAAKAPETLGWLWRFIRGQRGRFGRIYVRFGEPVSLRALLGTPADLPAAGTPEARHVLRRLAFEASARINRSMPITGAALVTIALLAAHDRALTLAQLRVALRGYLDHARHHGHVLAASAQGMESEGGLAALLETLRPGGLIEAIAGGTATVYRIAAGRHLQAAYYRNTIVHFFLEGAIGELALLHAAAQPRERRRAAFVAEVLALRELLEYEFYFPEPTRWLEAVECEVERLAPGWTVQLDSGLPGIEAALNTMPTLSSDTLLRPFIECFGIVADVLQAAGARQGAAGAELQERCFALGGQYLAQRRLRNADAISGHLFTSAERLVRHRDLCDPHPDVDLRRAGFVAQLRDLQSRMDVVRRIAIRRVDHDQARGIC